MEVGLVGREHVGAVFRLGDGPTPQHGTILVRNVWLEENVLELRIFRQDHVCEKGRKDIHAAGYSNPDARRGHLLEKYMESQRIEPDAPVLLGDEDGMVTELVGLLHTGPIRGALFGHVLRAHLVKLD